MQTKVIIVDDERAIRDILSDALRQAGYEVLSAADGNNALSFIRDENIQIAICDIKMPGMSGIELLKRILDVSPETVVIMITAYASVETAVDALRYGAYDYTLKPLICEEVVAKISKIDQYLRIKKENQILRQEVETRYDFQNIIAKSRSMQDVFHMICKVSETTSNVLITGESGTGKEMVARAVHFNSPMKDRKFVPINCGTIPSTLWESELFGHVQGAFTGATGNKQGYLKIVEEGTLFLDEISEIPLDAQVKLMRVIENQEFTPLGSVKTQRLNARIIAASNKDLKEMVEQGRFRDDLYYRLNVVHIQIPPLRERKEDIPLLVRYFVSHFNRELGKNIKGADNMTMKVLLSYNWRGNVRELKNVIERSVIFCENEMIGVQDLPAELQESGKFFEPMRCGDLKQNVKDFEKVCILSVLEEVSFDKIKAAAILGLSKSSLYRKMEELGIDYSARDSRKQDS